MATLQACLGYVVTFRICARLDTKDQQVVKGIQFEGLRVIGDINELTKKYEEVQQIDEILILNTVNSWFSKAVDPSIYSLACSQLSIPITMGGGLRNMEQVDACFAAGADRVAFNTIAFSDPNLIFSAAQKYGEQAIVLYIQTRTINGKWFCFNDNGRQNTTIPLQDWIVHWNTRPVGEFLVVDIDRDGTSRGAETSLLTILHDLCEKSVLYGGGISQIGDAISITRHDIQGIVLSAALHYDKISVPTIKRELEAFGVLTRESE
jgi:imidazoleglycerol phosphate synthase cyclase subunit